MQSPINTIITNNPNSGKSNNTWPFLAGGGEMGDLIRSKDWSETALGKPSQWDSSLKFALSLMLNSFSPMYIAWGKEYIQFYNDAYKAIIGPQLHESALGNSSKHTFGDIWETIEPMFKQVRAGSSVHKNNFRLPLLTNGKIQDRWFDFSYSPIKKDDGTVGGIFVTAMDSTERIIAQTALRESKEELEFAINAGDFATWRYDPVTLCFKADRKLAEWLGISDFQGIDVRTIYDLMPDEDSVKVKKAFEEAKNPRSNGDFSVDYCVKGGGQSRYLRTKGRAYFNKHHQPYKFAGTTQDITRDVLAKKKLIKTERNLMNVMRHAPVAMAVFTGPDYVVELANQKAFEIWGKTTDEMINKPLFAGLPEARNQGFEQILKEVYTTGESLVVSEKQVLLPRNGVLQPFYIHFSYEALRSSGGEIAGIISVAIDITEEVIARRKIEEAEERTRFAIESADMGTYDFNFQLKHVITSARFDEMFGIPASNDPSVYFSVVHPEDGLAEAFAESLKSGRLSHVFRVFKNQQEHWLHIQGRTYFDEQGEPVRMLGTLLDITEQRRLQQQKDDFIAIASHELKTPLTSLNAAMQLLNRKAVVEASAALSVPLHQANKSLRRLTKLVRDLLDVTKIRAGHLVLNKTVFTIAAHINDCCPSLASNANFNLEVRGDLNAKVFADRDKIEQVVVNLVNNAVKYAPQSKTILVDVEEINEFVKVSVIDHGPGIPEEKLWQLFDRYYQIENQSVQVSGLGLGLYISSEIIRKHGGEIGVVSELGKGSTFWFTLPKATD